MRYRILRSVATIELKVSIRNRWTIIFAAVFAVLAFGISYFGLASAGMIGLQGFTRTTASLLNLVLYLVPLMALVLGTLSLCPEPGSQELLYAQPLLRQEILFGKLVGLFQSIAASTLLGFGLAGLLITYRVGTEGLFRYLALVLLALALALVFLVLSAVIAGLARARVKAFGLALFVWFLFVIFYDLLVIGISFALQEVVANRVLLASLFGNPVDMVRVSVLLILGGPTLFGPGGAALVKALGSHQMAILALCAGLAAWILAGALVSSRLFRRVDL